MGTSQHGGVFPDGNEVYWAPMISFPGEIYSRGGLLIMKRVDGKYERPVNLGGPINSAAGETSPFIALDGSFLVFSR